MARNACDGMLRLPHNLMAPPLVYCIGEGSVDKCSMSVCVHCPRRSILTATTNACICRLSIVVVFACTFPIQGFYAYTVIWDGRVYVCDWCIFSLIHATRSILQAAVWRCEDVQTANITPVHCRLLCVTNVSESLSLDWWTLANCFFVLHCVGRNS